MVVTVTVTTAVAGAAIVAEVMITVLVVAATIAAVTAASGTIIVSLAAINPGTLFCRVFRLWSRRRSLHIYQINEPLVYHPVRTKRNRL